MVEQAIEDNMNSRTLRKNPSKGKVRKHKMKDANNNAKYGKTEIINIIQDFYKEFYSKKSPASSRGGPRIDKVLHVDSEDLPEVTRCEVTAAINQMKSTKSPGEDRVTEMLKKE
ncbi:hypothetical protein HHI36_005837, partial [Cryptolaemus montrouzieri]